MKIRIVSGNWGSLKAGDVVDAAIARGSKQATVWDHNDTSWYLNLGDYQVEAESEASPSGGGTLLGVIGAKPISVHIKFGLDDLE